MRRWGPLLLAWDRINNEFEPEDLTLEGLISMPVNAKLGQRTAVQTSDMNKGWIRNNAGANTYANFDAATTQQRPGEPGGSR